MSRCAIMAALGLMLAAGAAGAQPQPATPTGGPLRAGVTVSCPAGLPITPPAGWTAVQRGSGPFMAPLTQAVLTDQGAYMCMYGSRQAMIASSARGCAVVTPNTWQGDLNAVSAITCGAQDYNGVSHPEACQVRCQP